MPGNIFLQFARKRSRVGECVSSTRNARPLPPSAAIFLRKFVRDIFQSLRAYSRFSLFCDKTFRARRIVKIENRRLDERVRRAAARRMQRIAFELDRPAINRRGDERNRAVAPRHRGRVVEGFSGNRPLHVFRERNEMQLPGGDNSLGQIRRAPSTRPSISRNSRRDHSSPFSSAAPAGNSRSSHSRNSGVSLSSPRLRQYVVPVGWLGG